MNSHHDMRDAGARDGRLPHELLDEDYADGDGTRATVDPSGYYKLLGLNVSASPQEIRKAFLFLSQRYHTDKHSNQVLSMQEAMNARFQELQDAYTVLSNEKTRAAYDAAGAKGAERLALVPAHYTSRSDIIGHIHFLDRRDQLAQTAKMLSSASDTTVNYSTVPIFQAAATRPEAQAGASAHEGAAPEPQEDSGEGASSSSGGGDEAQAEAGAAPAVISKGPQTVEAQMVAREVLIDGVRRLVFIPSANVEEQVRARMRAAELAAAGGDGGGVEGEAASSSVFGSAVRRRMAGRPMRMLRAAALSAIPTSLAVRHSFEHAVGSRTTVHFRSEAFQDRSGSRVSMQTCVSFQQDDVNTYEAMLVGSPSGLKLTLARQVVLSPIWSLRTVLTCFDSANRVLKKLELELTRKLSETTELTNTLAWSIYENGFFSSHLRRTWERGSQSLRAYIGYHSMNLTAYTDRIITYGVDTRDPKYPPVRGRIQYGMNCSPFSGQTQVGFEAWYYHEPLKHYGIGFTTVLPYAFSPVAPPLFFVESSQYAVVNQVSLLYSRGKHHIRVPVIVFISPRVSQALLWVSVPLLLHQAARIAYRPFAKARAARYYAKLRLEHLSEMDIAREKASLEQRALELAVMQSRALEDRKGGLVIINARYGVLSPAYAESDGQPVSSPATRHARRGTHHAPPFFSRMLEWTVQCFRRALRGGRAPSGTTAGAGSVTPPFTPATNSIQIPGDAGEEPVEVPLAIDVTLALQNLVRDSALVLSAGTKSTLVGFCDPDPFTPERKQLKVTYWFRKKKHCAIFDDDDVVELPQRDHLVQ